MFEGELPFDERLGEEGFLRAFAGLRRVFREDMRRSKRDLRNDSIYGGSEDLTSERTKAVQTAGSSPRWGAALQRPYNANSRKKIAALLGARRRLVRGIEGKSGGSFLDGESSSHDKQTHREHENRGRFQCADTQRGGIWRAIHIIEQEQSRSQKVRTG